MKVWVIFHDDGFTDGYRELRGIYATEEAAKAAQVTRTPTGRKSTAWGAHDTWCCEIEEREVES